MSETPSRRSTDGALGAVRMFLGFLDRRSVFRRIAFCWMIWLTTKATFWCFAYASTKLYMDGLQTAAVIAAVMTPIAGLQGAVFKFYSETRQEQSP
jgi:hypothetical protein